MGFGATSLEVPFTKVGSDVFGVSRLEKLRDGLLFFRQSVNVLRWQEAITYVETASISIADVGKMKGSRAASGEKRSARGRAVGMRRVALSESHPGSGETFDVGGSVKVAFGVGDFGVVDNGGRAPALIVSEDDDEVGPRNLS